MFKVLRRRALRDKIIAAFLIPTVLIALLTSALTYMAAREGLERELGLRLAAIGQVLAADLSSGLEADQLARMDASKVRTRERLLARLEAARAATGAHRLFLFDRDLNSLVDTAPQVDFGQRLFTLDADRFEIERAIESGDPALSVLFRDADGTPYKTAYLPVTRAPRQGEPERVVAMLGVAASASFFDLLTNFASGLALLGLLSVALVVAIGATVGRALARPLNDLVEAAKRLEQGDLEHPVLSDQEEQDASGGDEIASLRVSFERMRRALLGRDRQLQMMLSGIAHEVRNPLGGVELFCGLLREDIEWMDEPDAEMLEKVDRIQREVGYLDKVVTDFLDFARHRPLQTERFEAREALEEIARLLAPDAASQGCEIEVDVAPEDLDISGDRERLRRAVINTARNAWQASPEGGLITLRARAQRDGRWRVISVQDRGQGMSPEVLEEILEPFFTTREKGSGLGLALTQRVIAQHGGRLRVESELGVGTRVIFELLFDAQAAARAPQAELPQGWLG